MKEHKLSETAKALRRLWQKKRRLWLESHPEEAHRAAKRKALYKHHSTWYDRPEHAETEEEKAA